MSNNDKQQPALAHKLQNLNAKFGATLQQYKTTMADYTALLQSAAMEQAPVDASGAPTGAMLTGKQDLYAVIPNSTYWGQMGLNEGASHSPSECLADCYTKPTCTGATYDSEANYCWIRTGDGRIAPGKTNQTAVIKKSMLYRDQLQDLHRKLQDIGDKIIDAISTNSAAYAEDTSTQQQHREMVGNVQQTVAATREELELLYREKTTLSNIETNTALLTNQNYWRYLMWLSLALLLGMILMKVLFLPDAQPSTGLLQSGGSNHFSGSGLLSVGLGFVTQTIESLGDLVA